MTAATWHRVEDVDIPEEGRSARRSSMVAQTPSAPVADHSDVMLRGALIAGPAAGGRGTLMVAPALSLIS